MLAKSDGIAVFLQRYCPQPALLMPLFTGERRVETLAPNQPLCSMDEDADCIWIVEEGLLQVMAGVSAVWRQAGDIIGEMAFLRNFAGVSATRGNDVVAACRTKVWRIDRSTLDGLSYEARAVWYETIARALVAKLDQASQLRAGHARDLATGDQIIRRLVCPEGVQAASATLLNGAEHIPPVKKTAVIWFSDLSGFSAHSEDLDAIKVGEDLRRLTDPQVEEITAARGQVDKHMGDAVMAFWLCPDPTRLRRSLADATRAALRAAQRVSEIAEASKIPIGIRIGLHVGEVSVGDFGGGDRIAFTIVGQPVNEAARYEQHRLEPGQPGGRVRVSDKVFTALPDELRSSFQPAALEFFDKHDRRFVAFLSSI